MAPSNARDRAAYPLTEAARYLKLPVTTLRTWVVGRPYPVASGTRRFHALIRPASAEPVALSFWNLVEAHVLRSLRQDHAVSLKALRTALAFAEKSLHIEHLLLSKELRARGGQIFLDRYGKLISLSASGQFAMRELFLAHLDRVEWDDREFPIRLHPWVSSAVTSKERPIAIDPDIAFGRPVVKSKSISTAAITARIDAGETLEALAADYEISAEEVRQAVVYEHAA